jgi:hypothetical protein
MADPYIIGDYGSKCVACGKIDNVINRGVEDNVQFSRIVDVMQQVIPIW